MGQRKRHPKLNRGGFTLIEVLLTVGILAVLLTVTMPNLVQTQKELRQTGLDARAQVLYTAVQNQLLKLRADGRAGEYAHLATETNGVRNAGSGEIDGRTVDLCYLSSQDRGMDAVDLVMAPGVAEEELRDADWVVVYEPEGGSVVDVFFSESGALDYGSRPGHFNGLRGDWAVRLADGATVGWYGGGALIAPSQRTEKLEPTITVDNGEQLIVYFRCKKPVKNAANHLEFQISLSDREGHAWSYNYTYTSGSLNWDVTTDVYSVGLLLDDLTGTEGRFDHVLGSASAMPEGQKLTPGYLKAEVTVTCPTDPSMESGYAQAETNSLFADGSTEDTAYISCCRHLQNLDASSGVDSKIKIAIQRMPLSFEDDPGRTDDWYDCYHGSYFNGLTGGTANFKPIEPAGLTSYNGNRLKIEGLTVDSEGQGGLFFSGTGFTWKNMILASPQVYARETTIVENGKDKIIAHSGALTAVAGNNCLFEGITVTDASVHSENVTKGSSNAGGLVGQVVGAGTVIRDCNVYLDPEKLKDSGKTDSDIWISGRNCGGLVGNVTTGPSLGVEDSFASTVVGIKADKNADVSAGGLVGELGGGAGLTLTRSYADCYLYGSRTGGLVAETKNGDAASRVSMTSCYAAGFQSASSAAAGLVNGLVGDASRCYTISNMTMTDKTDMYGVARESSGTVNNVYYAQAGRYDALPGTSPIVLGTLFNDLGGSGAGFRRSVLGTKPYELRSGLDLSNYPCPQLKADGKALIHYGDWLYEGASGVFGLSNGTMYNEVTRTTDQSQVEVRAWPTGKPALAGARFFLYGSLPEGDLADAEIVKLRVLVGGVEQSVNQSGALYAVTFSSKIAKDSAFEYKAGTLGYFGEGSVKNVTVEVTLKDPVTNVQYALRTLLDVSKTYVVTFLPNGGQGTMDPIYTEQEWMSSPSCLFTRSGYEFAGWKDTATGANWEGDCTRNPKLEAQWVPAGSLDGITYHLHFMANGHNFWDANGQYVEYYVGLRYDELHTLWGVGYSVNGKKLLSWNTSPDGTGTRYECGQVVSRLTNVPWGRVYLYAQWEETQYQIAFDGNGQPGTMNPLNVKFSQEVALPGHSFQAPGSLKFTGWFHSEQNKVYQPGDVVKELGQFENQVVTLYALWGNNHYYIKLDNNGVNYYFGSYEKGYPGLAFDEDLTLPDDSIYAEGKMLAGWNTEADGSGTAYAPGQTVRGLSFEDNKEIRLYAQWVSRGGLRLSTNLLGWEQQQISPGNVYGKDRIDAGVYPALSRPGGSRDLDWSLEGWYTSNEPGKGIKVLNPDGTVAVQELDGWVKDGKLCMEENKTIYARWWQYGYLPVTALADGNEEEYLIMDKVYYGAGEGHFLSSANGNKVDGVEGARTVGTGTVEIKVDWNNVVHDEEGNVSYLYIDSNGQDQRWIFQYETTEGGRRYYQIKSKADPQRLLCRLGDGIGMYTFTLEEIQAVAPGDYRDRMLWYYGSISYQNNLLADKRWIGGNDTLRWEDGRGFFVGPGFGPVYLYRLQKIYQFY